MTTDATSTEHRLVIGRRGERSRAGRRGWSAFFILALLMTLGQALAATATAATARSTPPVLTAPGTNAATLHCWFGGDGHGGRTGQGRIASGVPIA